MTTLDQRAIDIIKGNDRGGYTVPTHGLYPYQWNWDSALAAWGMAEFDSDRAWQELETLFTGQWASGMLPHIIFHTPDVTYFPGPDVWQTGQTPATSGITQPPVAATCARAVFESDPVMGAQRVAALLPKMEAWHQWFFDTRCEHGAVAITHPWESGRDNAPDWDSAAAHIDVSQVGEYTRRDTTHVNADMRPKKLDYDRYLALVYGSRSLGWDDAKIREHGEFRVLDPGMTFILIRATRDLIWLAQQLDRPTDALERGLAHVIAGLPAIWNTDRGHYDSFDALHGEFANSLSNASFLCWFGGIDSGAMDTHLAAELAHAPFGIPSLSTTDPRFDADRYWRGPSWPFLNALIATGLNDAGKTDEAEQLRAANQQLIESAGFYEYFNPMTATGAGGAEFTWTAAVWLAWIRKGIK